MPLSMMWGATGAWIKSLAATAGPFTADVALDLEHSGGVIELLADILANALEMGAAAALSALRLVPELPARERGRQGHAARLCFGSGCGSFSQRFDLEAHGLDVRIDAFIQQRALHGIELLGVLRIAPAIEGRDLVGELIDLQLPALEFLIAPDELGLLLCELGILLLQPLEERRGQIPQLLCVHLSPFARHFHELDVATSSVISTRAFATTRGSCVRSSKRSHGSPTTIACSCS